MTSHQGGPASDARWSQADPSIRWIADQCQPYQLSEKWLVAEQLRVAQQWKDRVALSGCPTLNLHSKTLATIALSLVSHELTAGGLKFCDRQASRMIVREVVGQLQDEGGLQYFDRVQSRDGLSDLLTHSIQDLRLAGLEPSSVSEASLESATKAGDIGRILEAYNDTLSREALVDYADCVEMTTRAIDEGSIDLPESLLILVPALPTLSAAERGLLRALGEKVTLRHAQQYDPYAVASEQIPQRLLAADGVEFFAGLGEANEIRGVFQRVISQRRDRTRLDDVEILHTDYHQYVPLILEQVFDWCATQSSEAGSDRNEDYDLLPITFSEGIACIYSRPGRALRGWLRWIRHDYIQNRLVSLIREGLLRRPEAAEGIGYSRLASTLREIPIGFRADRYLPKIQATIVAAEQSREAYLQNHDPDGDGGNDASGRRDFGLPALRALHTIAAPLVSLAPLATDDGLTILRKAKEFLLRCSRSSNRLDRYARQRLLDDIDGMSASLQFGDGVDDDILRWLEQLPTESRILSSGPQPGRAHVAPLQHGGHSGRRRVFVVGLDDGRYPKRIAVDPVLLDSERRSLSSELVTAEETSQLRGLALERALFRATADPKTRVCLSYSTANLIEDRDCYPSGSMLEIFRIAQQREDADLDDLLAHLGAPCAFVSTDHDDHLSTIDRELATLLELPGESSREQWLEQRYKFVRFQRLAFESHRSEQLGPFDGWVPRAGKELDPTEAKRVSPTRMEAYGACPRRYLLRYGLGLYPPDEWIIDQQRWLDGLQVGVLVHGVFEEFLCELTRKNLVPNLRRDRTQLEELLYRKIDRLKDDVPIPNEDAYRRTCDLLEETCEIFLAKEEEYCRQHDAHPWVLEASLGLGETPSGELDCAEPIPLELSDGRVIRLGGRLDRVDRLMSGGSESYAIWDYKSGSAFGFDREKPFQQGRKLQPCLYLGMLRHRLATLGKSKSAAESFGYFFPSPKSEGLRLQWTRAQLRSGDAVLRQICNLIADGVFVPTTNADDCKYCDYRSVCGDPVVVAEQSMWKSMQNGNDVLKPWRDLREIERDGGGSA